MHRRDPQQAELPVTTRSFYDEVCPRLQRRWNRQPRTLAVLRMMAKFDVWAC
jgi:hypothetical protein